MQVLNDHVIIKENERSETTDGGILYAPTSIDKSILRKGVVLEAGSGTTDNPKPESLVSGKEVLFDMRGAIDLVVEDKKFVVVKLQQVVAVLN